MNRSEKSGENNDRGDGGDCGGGRDSKLGDGDANAPRVGGEVEPQEQERSEQQRSNGKRPNSSHSQDEDIERPPQCNTTTDASSSTAAASDKVVVAIATAAMTTTSNENNPTTGLTLQKRTPKRKADPAVLATRRAIQQCCATNDLPTALQAFDEAMEQGIRIEADSYYNLLSLCGGLSDRPCHIGTPLHNNNNTNQHQHRTKQQQKQQSQQPKNVNSNKNKEDNTSESKASDDKHQSSHQPQENQDANVADSLPSDQDRASSSSPSSPPLANNNKNTNSNEKNIANDNSATMSWKDRKRHAFRIKACMDQQRLPLSESAYTALIKLLCQQQQHQQQQHGQNQEQGQDEEEEQQNNFKLAEQLLTQAEQDSNHCKCKLRLYSSLLIAYCHKGSSHDGGGDNNDDDKSIVTTDVNSSTGAASSEPSSLSKAQPQPEPHRSTLPPSLSTNTTSMGDGNTTTNKLVAALLSALQIWFRLTQRELALTEREYMALIQCCARIGNHLTMVPSSSSSSNTLQEADSDSYSAAAAALVMERVLSDLAQDVLVPSRACSQAICDWYKSAAASFSPCRGIYSNDKNNDKGDDRTATTSDDGSGEKSEIEQQRALYQQIEQVLERIRTCQQEQQAVVPLDVVSMGPVQTDKGWTISPSCSIDTTTGVLLNGCLQGHWLQPVPLGGEEIWEGMRQANETIVLQGGLKQHKSIYQGGRKGKKKPRLEDRAAQERRQQWEQFQKFLEQRNTDERALDFIVDGANIGYYQTNFQGAPKHLDYHQLDWMIRHLRRQPRRQQRGGQQGTSGPNLYAEKQDVGGTLSGSQHKDNNNNDRHGLANVLVFLHVRHLKQAPPEYRSMMQRWKNSGVLYSTPWGMNDDSFWIQAALYFPGALLVTNDEMRDHFFQMLAPRSFVRWKERHQIHFTFGGWQQQVDDEADHAQSTPERRHHHQKRQCRQVLLQYPDRYSRRIQRIFTTCRSGSSDGVVEAENDTKNFVGLVIPLPKRGDVNRFLDGKHMEGNNDNLDKDEAGSADDDERYICIRVVNQ
ncbi:hypothetical protein ACA910_005384 [Epithemia clementina (nom. ined.)]